MLLEEVDGKANGHKALEKYSSIGGCDGSYGSEDRQIVAVVDAVVDVVACVVVKIWKPPTLASVFTKNNVVCIFTLESSFCNAMYQKITSFQ